MEHVTHFFKYIEPITDTKISTLPPILRINETSPKEVILFRLLSGTLDLHNSNISKILKQRKNYLLLGISDVNKVTPNYILDLLANNRDNDLTNKYFTLNRQNTLFFDNLIYETSNFFIKTLKNNNITAFVHLYRSIEYISYTFPLIYASKSRDYVGTFNELKGWMSNDVKSELKFFKKFQETLIDDLSVLDIELKINFNASEIEKESIRLMFEELESIGCISLTSNIDGEIKLLYKHFHNFIIAIRNRYFHMLSGTQRSNISRPDINMETIFKAVNPFVLNWISYIYYEILLYSMRLVN